MKKILSSVLVGVFPVVALAQTTAFQYQGGGIGGLMLQAGNLLKLALPLIISLAVVYFVFQVFRYAVAGDEEAKAKAKTQMIWGIIGIFVMVSIWGLVAILQSTFGTSAVQGNIGNQLPI